MPQGGGVMMHSVAVEIVVNGVLRTLWVDAKPIARSASIKDHYTASYARAVSNIDGD